MENPFAAIGPMPEGEDPQEQLLYLQHVVEAFQQTSNPRIKPLRKQLGIAIENLALAADRGDQPEQIGLRFQRDVRELQVQTYDLILVLVNQFRASLRIKLLSGMPPPEKMDGQQLQKALGEYAQALRKVINALKKNDPESLKDAGECMDKAHALLNETTSAS